MIRKLNEGGMFKDKDPNENKIKKTIREMKRKGMTTEISIKWMAEDVLSMDDTLTPEQVEDVLGALERKHDANIGINWEVISFWIDNFKNDK